MQSRVRKRSADASPELDAELMQKKFKCVKCSVRLQDVKLLKIHFWRVHIQHDEIFNHLNVNDKYLLKSTFRKKTPTKFAEKQKKRKRSATSANISYRENVSDSSTDSEVIDQQSSDEDDSNRGETMIEKVNKLTSDQVRWFNLTKEQIDEREIADLYRPLDHSAEFDKSRHYLYTSVTSVIRT